MYNITRTDDEINGSRWPGMSYEQGVEAGIQWLVGDTDDNPMED